MGKRKRASKGKECLGVFRSTERCNRARDKSGLPIVLNSNCKHCGEQRCRAHCKCGRDKTDKAKGRCAARGLDGKAAIHVPAAAPTIPAPVGRASPPSCKLVEVTDWYEQLCADVKRASEVELASYVYDNPAVQRLLLKRLQGKTDFKVNVYIDSEMFAGEVPRFQKSRVKALHAAGAQVFICTGRGPRGSYHGKAVVVGRRYLYMGSPNLTYKSQSSNEEFCFRAVGPVVKQLLEKLAQHRQKGKLWNGA